MCAQSRGAAVYSDITHACNSSSVVRVMFYVNLDMSLMPERVEGHRVIFFPSSDLINAVPGEPSVWTRATSFRSTF